MTSIPANRDGGPLGGIKVLDLSAYIAGPYSCALLADLGAEVVKIEPPGGDQFRQYPSTLAKEARGFIGINRSKRSIVLDLKQIAAREVLDRLIISADVLVHNFRPSVPARLGLDYPRLASLNPRLVYCGLTGYGEVGPLKDRAGFDQVLQSMTGICMLQGARSGHGPELVGGSIVDYYAASMIAYGVSAALYQRERSGKGQKISVSLLGSALAMQATRLVWADGEPREIGRELSAGGITGIYKTKQGSLYLQASAPHFWTALCEAIERPALATDQRFATVRKRAENAAILVPMVQEALLARTAREWEAALGEEVACAEVKPVEAMFEDAQVLENGHIETYEHALVGKYRGFAKPIHFETTSAPTGFAAPALGQHTHEVLRENGFSDAQIAKLEKLGVLGKAS